MALPVDQAHRGDRIKRSSRNTFASAPGTGPEPNPDGRWPTLFPMIACFIGSSGRVPNAFEEADRFLLAVLELQTQEGWPVYRLTVPNARILMGETPNRRLLGSCIECGQIFHLLPSRGRPQMRCCDCADELRRGVPYHRRRARLPADPRRLSEMHRLCWWCGRYLPEAARADARTCSTNCRVALNRYFDTGGWMSAPNSITGRAKIRGQDTPARPAAARYRGIPVRPDPA